MGKTITDPDLAMSDAEVDRMLPAARREAEQAAERLAAAEAIARGETPPPSGAALSAEEAAELTPAGLVEMRAAVELAQMRVGATERRVDELRDKRHLHRQGLAAEHVRAEAAGDLACADGIVAAVNAFEAALQQLYEVTTAHNDRVATWTQRMRDAGAGRGDSPEVGTLGNAYQVTGEGIIVAGKTYRPLDAHRLIGTTVYRAMKDHRTDGYDITHQLSDWRDLRGPVDVKARIRADA